MPQFFEKLIAEEQRRGLALPSFLSTHPDTRARIAALEALIAEKGKGEARAFSADWSAARKECKPVPLADPDKELPTLP
jgi:predicted Zn-dependent protease